MNGVDIIRTIGFEPPQIVVLTLALVCVNAALAVWSLNLRSES